MLEFAQKYGGNRYSQNGEDFIINEMLMRIDDPTFNTAVEFGGADGYYCSNTANLRDHKLWEVFMYDLQAYPPLVEQKEITT